MPVRIIPRGEWGARHPNGGGTAPLPAGEVWLHHSVTIAPDVVPPFDDDYAAVRTLEDIGQQRFGQGISYTWAITPAGLIFEGHSVGRLGAHTGGRNSIARAICFIGNYDNQHPTLAQIQAAAWLLQEAKRQGWIRSPRLNGGHRDVKSTGCPGTHAYAAIGLINQLAAGPPITEIEEDDMATAQEIADAVWAKVLDNPTGGPDYQAQDYLRYANMYAAEGANDEGVVMTALANLLAAIGKVDGTPSDEQMDVLAGKLKTGLGDELADALGRRLLAS